MASEETEVKIGEEKPESSQAPPSDSCPTEDPDDKESLMYTTADEDDAPIEKIVDKKPPNSPDKEENSKKEDSHDDGVELVPAEREDGDVTDDDQRSQRSDSTMSSGSQVPDAEREEGDGQEEGDKKDKKLDHDEDRRDPQYIPKRGIFYEHDDRTMDEVPEEKKEPVREPKKSRAFEAAEKWGHDMYDESEQSPKSIDELVDAYGYDIRKEEAPPKARRRRRYGKGPNKYQRNWEDEQAYNKSPLRGGYRGGQKRPPRNFVNRDEDFPTLPNSGAPASDEAPNKGEVKGPKPSVKFPTERAVRQPPEETKSTKVHQDGGERRPREATRGRGGARRGRGGGEGPFRGHGPNERQTHGKGPSTADEDIATLAQHFSNAVINIDKNIAPIRSQSEPPAEEKTVKEERQQHQGSGHHKHHEPPSNKHLSNAEVPSTKSKRYSTQRQRPAQPTPPQGSSPQISAPQGPAPNYLPPQQGYFPPQHGMIPQEGPAPHMAGPPNQFPPPPGGMQVVTFLPTVPPPPTNTFQPPPNIYVPPAPYIPPPPIVQPGPAELYQGGVTYYNTQSQQLTRAAPSRRVKLAIPIVAPDNSASIQ